MDKLAIFASGLKGKKMSHLTEQQRYTISAMLSQNFSQTTIAATGLCWLALLGGKESEPLKDALIRRLSPLRGVIKTATADNGKEFAAHKEIAEALGIDVFFAHPYHSWERGANENMN